MSPTPRSDSETMVLRTAAVWGTFVLASRELRSGQSLHIGEGPDALVARPDASTMAELPIRAVGNGWELDARGATGGVLHLRGRAEDPSVLGAAGAPVAILPGDYGLLQYGAFAVFFQFARAARPPQSRLRLDIGVLLSFLFAFITVGGGLLLLYMLYPEQPLPKPLELTSPEELIVQYHFTPPPPETTAGDTAEGGSSGPAEAKPAASASKRRAPAPSPAREPAAPASGIPGGSSAMTEVLQSAVGKQVQETLGSISAVSEALGGLSSSGLVLGTGSAGTGLRAGGGGGQGTGAVFGAGVLDTGSGTGGTGSGRGRGSRGAGSGAGSGLGGERQVAAAAVSKPGQGLSPEQISRVVLARAGAFRACYESAVAREPKLEGGLTISFTVSPSGSVNARVASSTLSNARVEGCVLRMFNRLRFPPADKPTSANWPLVFKPGKQ